MTIPMIIIITQPNPRAGPITDSYGKRTNIIVYCFSIYAIMFSKYFHRFSSRFIGGDCSAAQTSVQPSFYGIPARRAGKRLSPTLPPPGYRSDNHDRQYLVTAELSVYHHRLSVCRRAIAVSRLACYTLVSVGITCISACTAAQGKKSATL